MAGVPGTSSQDVFIPSMRTTLSLAAPDKAHQIRSAVTGALKKDSSGLLCFETTVETTFLLPWDLNPVVSVQPRPHYVMSHDCML